MRESKRNGEKARQLCQHLARSAPRAGPLLSSTPTFWTNAGPIGSNASFHTFLLLRPSKIALDLSPVSPSGPKTKTLSSLHGTSPWAKEIHFSCMVSRTRVYECRSTGAINQHCSSASIIMLCVLLSLPPDAEEMTDRADGESVRTPALTIDSHFAARLLLKLCPRALVRPRCATSSSSLLWSPGETVTQGSRSSSDSSS